MKEEGERTGIRVGTWECDSPCYEDFSLWCWCARQQPLSRMSRLPSTGDGTVGRSFLDMSYETILGTWYRRSKEDNSKAGPRKGVEVDPVSGRSRIPAHRSVHRASSCATASTHAFKWVGGSPHASQSAREPNITLRFFSKKSVVPAGTTRDGRSSVRLHHRTRAIDRA